MSKANESAFPTNIHKSQSAECGLDLGLTKRELFAAMAMQAAMNGYLSEPKNAAKLAVEHADALIKELEKSDET